MIAPSPLDDAVIEQRAAINWAARLWVLTFLVGLVVAAGLTPGLQGAFIGAGPVIQRAQLLGSHLSQFAALLGLLLLVYLAVLSIRASRNLFVGVAIALLGTIPAVVLYHASRSSLPAMVSAVTAMASACVVLACASQSRVTTLLRVGAFSAGISLLMKVAGFLLLEREAGAEAVRAAAGIASASSWLALACIFAHYATTHRPLGSALALMASFVPAATAQSLHQGGEVSSTLATMGHTVSALVGSDAQLLRGYGFTLALVLAALNVISPRAKLSFVAASLLVLCVFSPVTPAACAAVTVGSYLLLVVPEQNESPIISSI